MGPVLLIDMRACAFETDVEMSIVPSAVLWRIALSSRFAIEALDKACVADQRSGAERGVDLDALAGRLPGGASVDESR